MKIVLYSRVYSSILTISQTEVFPSKITQHKHAYFISEFLKFYSPVNWNFYLKIKRFLLITYRFESNSPLSSSAADELWFSDCFTDQHLSSVSNISCCPMRPVEKEIKFLKTTRPQKINSSKTLKRKTNRSRIRLEKENSRYHCIMNY